MTADSARGSAYERVVEHFRGQIAAGELNNGQRLPAVRQIMTTFGVSRTTADKAMSVLQSEGLVRSMSGRGGTVVDVHNASDQDVDLIVEVDRGRVSVTSVDVVPAKTSEGQRYGLEAGATAVRIRLKIQS